MTPEKKKLLIYGGGAAALTLLVYFVFFSKKFTDKLKKAPTPIIPTPAPEPTPELYLPSSVSTRSGTRLRKDPNTNSTILKTYQSGVTLYTDDSKEMEDGLWYHISSSRVADNYNQSDRGWVRSDVVDDISGDY